MAYLNGAVICDGADKGHVHDACHSNPFKVVLVTMYREDHRPITYFYTSMTDLWVNKISTPAPFELLAVGRPGSLGNAIY